MNGIQHYINMSVVCPIFYLLQFYGFCLAAATASHLTVSLFFNSVKLLFYGFFLDYH